MSRKIIMAGAGLGGLTAAACMLEEGFDVEIYEQAPKLGEVGAGIQMSANAVRVLNGLGLGPRLEEMSGQPKAYRFRLWDNGEVLQEIPLGQTYRDTHGVDYHALHRADLHAILVDKVRSLKPDAIHLGRAAKGFDEDESGVTLHLADGGSARGDVLIGADGIKSAIRAQIIGPTPPEYTGQTTWRVLVPKERLPAEFAYDTVDIWVGPHRHGVVYPLRRGELINFVGSVDCETWEDENWTQVRPWEEMKADFAGWHPAIQALIDSADTDACYRWALNHRMPVRNWSTRRATLMGDAAHPTLPYMAQGAVMAIEDAAVLTRALCLEPDDTAAALDLYQRNRVDRTARVVNESFANSKMFHLESSEKLKEAFSKRDIRAERTQWLFSYDARTVELV